MYFEMNAICTFCFMPFICYLVTSSIFSDIMKLLLILNLVKPFATAFSSRIEKSNFIQKLQENLSANFKATFLLQTNNVNF